ncbi:helix-hairpin-helix domain-containing protein [Nocardia sp. NPDC059177]|uniref:helix-hairpin-helix domain-containing protein n=1 Tax=Nocardia sp. NPDC059177 TaxID=3346759 RepID=UPI0036AD1C38
MSRHEEHERVRQRLGGMAVRDGVRVGGPPGRETGNGAGARDGHWDDDELTHERAGEVRLPSWLDDGESRKRNRFVPERFREARLDPGRRGAMALGVVGILAVMVTGVLVLRDQPIAQSVPPVPVVRAEAAAAQPETVAALAAVAGAGPATSSEVVVSVVGLVRHAGLHHLPSGSRVADAIEMAGGTREGADLAGLNLAQRLADGDQVVVGAATPQSDPRLGSAMISSGAPAATSAGGTSATPSTPGKSRVDLNTATESDLDALPGVGPVTAKAILAWRTTNGRFTDVAQLGEVDGIGPARLARLRDLVTT